MRCRARLLVFGPAQKDVRSEEEGEGEGGPEKKKEEEEGRRSWHGHRRRSK